MKLLDQPDRMDLRSDEEKQVWVERFLGGVGKRYVFGCNQWGLSVAEHARIDGFIDDVVARDSFGGLPVLRSGQADKDSMVVSAVVLGRPITASLFLRHSGFDALDYFSFLRFSTLPIDGFDYWSGGRESVVVNRSKFEWIRKVLADEESQEVFDRVMGLRQTLNLNVMSPFTDRQQEQYFEPFIRYPKDGVFYDVGAYDGSTSLEFVRHSGSYKAIHAFEPSASNRDLLLSKLGRLQNVHVHSKLLGSRNQSARLVDSGSASRVSETEGTEVEMVTLDSLSIDPPSFIKVDIEGAELEFLTGARATVRSHKPAIAIACYHAFDHIWQIPEFILETSPTYDVYLRHYTEGVTETDLFFVPKW